MLDIIGDEIILEGVTIAKFTGSGWPSLRERAMSIMDGAEADMISEDEHIETVMRAEADSYSSGRHDGREEAIVEVEKIRDKYFDEGYDAGRAAVLTAIERASDAKRVEALLNAVSEAHDVLFKITNQRYPAAKISALKRCAIGALSEIRLAINAYRRPNE